MVRGETRAQPPRRHRPPGGAARPRRGDGPGADRADGARGEASHARRARRAGQPEGAAGLAGRIPNTTKAELRGDTPARVEPTFAGPAPAVTKALVTIAEPGRAADHALVATRTRLTKATGRPLAHVAEHVDEPHLGVGLGLVDHRARAGRGACERPGIAQLGREADGRAPVFPVRQGRRV